MLTKESRFREQNIAMVSIIKTHFYICTLHLLLLESSQQLKILRVSLKKMVEWLGSDYLLCSGHDLNRDEQQW